MFTGLVETTGQLRSLQGRSPMRLTIESSIPTGEVAIGDSIAIDGCCLTVVAKDAECLSFEAATETLERTTLGRLRTGDRVNLERALRLNAHLGGHLVLGHVDGVGTVRVRERRGSAIYFGVEAPQEVLRLTAARGSIAIAGISLTVTDVDEKHLFVAVIPHTLDATIMGGFEIGTAVNLEADLLARYVERLLQTSADQAWDPQRPASGLTVDFLKDKGFA